MAKRLREWLEPLYRNYQAVDDDGMKSTFIAGQLSRRQDEALRQLRSTVEDHIKMLRTELLPEFIFWREEDQNHLRDQVTNAIDTLDRKALKNELLKGLDLNSVVSRLPHKIEDNLNIQKTFRSQLQRLLDEQMVKRHLAQLLKDLTASKVLPETVIQDLQDRLSGRDMLSRLKGMCDVFLFEYGDVINQFGRTVMEQEALHEAQSTESIMKAVQGNAEDALKLARSMNLLGPKDTIAQMRELGLDALSRIHSALTGSPPPIETQTAKSDAIDRALDYYKIGILDYARKQQHQINMFARRGIKNYFEELEVELLAYFDSIKGDIAQMIMRQLTDDIDAELNAEIQKQRIIKETYQFMTHEVGQDLRRAEVA